MGAVYPAATGGGDFEKLSSAYGLTEYLKIARRRKPHIIWINALFSQTVR